MTTTGNSTILVVGGQILTTGDFVFKARQESVDNVIDDFGPPIINLIIPSELKEGKRIEIIMSGNRTYNPLQALVHGEGVSVSSVQVNDDGQITLTCDVQEDALDNADGSEQRDVTITTLAGPSGEDIQDSDGNVITKSTTLSNAFRVYFGEATLSSSTAPNLEQGMPAQTISLSGLKMYDKWDGTSPMTVDMGPSITVQSVQVTDRNSAEVTFTVATDAQRGLQAMSAATYSGPATSSVTTEIYYRAPEASKLASVEGPHSISTSDENMEIEAGEEFRLRLTGKRLEGIDQGARLRFVDGTGQAYQHLAVSNPVATTPVGNGDGHSVDFTVTAAVDAPEAQAAQSLSLEYETISATGTHTAIFPCDLEIVPADPTIASFYVQGREGQLGEDTQAIEIGDGAVSCRITGKNIRAGYSLKVMKDDALGLVDATSEFEIANFQLEDNAANLDDTLTFDIKADGASQTDAAGALKYFFKVETPSGSSSNAPAWNVNQLAVLPGNPTITADPSGAVNHASVRKSSDAGDTAFSFTLTGTNLYNAVSNGNTSNMSEAAFNGGQGVYPDGAGEIKISLSNEAGISGLSCTSVSDTNATVSGTISNANMAAEGLKDITITTRSGQAFLAGVFDVLAPAPTVSSVTPNEQEEGTIETLTIAGANFFAGPNQTSHAGAQGYAGGAPSQEDEWVAALAAETAQALAATANLSLESTMQELAAGKQALEASLNWQSAHHEEGDYLGLSADFMDQHIGPDNKTLKEKIKAVSEMLNQKQAAEAEAAALAAEAKYLSEEFGNLMADTTANHPVSSSSTPSELSSAMSAWNSVQAHMMKRLSDYTAIGGDASEFDSNLASVQDKIDAIVALQAL